VKTTADSTTTTTTADSHATIALSLLKAHGDTLAAHFRALLSRYAGAPARLMESIEYSLMAGGKRLRPSLVLETCRACGGGAESNRSALAGAAAIELIHTFSLVHDDLPAMDDDDLRRGRPTNHKVFGEAMAILAGDAMVTMAFEVIALDAADPTAARRMTIELARAAGPEGMIGGQVLDMAGENQRLDFEQLKHLHRLKTGALLTAACRMGAAAAGADEATIESLTQFGRHLGLGFQIIDDVLDVTSTPEQMGKATGKDAGKGKNTYPGLLGLDGSRQAAREQLRAAIDALKDLGSQADGLRALAKFVVDRET
jgi:geranylgeranyl diphosphate synthase type II